MNNYKVGQRVKVISASTGTELNVSGWVGEIIEVQSDNFVGIKFAEYPLLYCFSDDGISLDLEVIPTPQWLPIDMDNLPDGKVAVIDYPKENIVYVGTLEVDENNRVSLEVSKFCHLGTFTHYIPLTDLLNLPIAE